jgi:hypothetical protein
MPMIKSGGRRVGAVVAAAVLCCAATAACSGSSSHGTSQSVFSVVPGQCFQAPTKVEAELSSLKKVDCADDHTREAYALFDYTPPANATAGAYPGSDALSSFAKGGCAQRYRAYVGVDYLDSSLFFTYLFPSARSWEQDGDRKIICFVTTTGAPLRGSVKGTKK